MTVRSAGSKPVEELDAVPRRSSPDSTLAIYPEYVAVATDHFHLPIEAGLLTIIVSVYESAADRARRRIPYREIISDVSP
jgi:hypothetical protein